MELLIICSFSKQLKQLGNCNFNGFMIVNARDVHPIALCSLTFVSLYDFLFFPQGGYYIYVVNWKHRYQNTLKSAKNFSRF